MAEIDIQSAILLTTLSFAAALLGGAILLVATRRRKHTHPAQSAALMDGTVFVFNGPTLWQASAEAEGFLKEHQDPAEKAIETIARVHRLACPGLPRMLDDLVRSGKSFLVDVEQADSSYLQIEGRATGADARIYFRDLTEDRLEKVSLRAAIDEAETSERQLRATVDAAPLMAWVKDDAGRVVWTNQAATEALSADGTLSPEFHLPGPEVKGQSWRAMLGGEGEAVDPTWYEVCEQSLPGNYTAGYAIEISKLVSVEGTLKRFIATLTETFAHLPIGLAIFDQQRRLGLFNPSLHDLLGLEPEWLARRPSLREFLDLLRSRNLSPQKQNLQQWLEFVAEVEREAVAGDLNRSWVTASDRTLRLTGRPHPHKSIALMFEDVSTTADVERSYRSEVQMSRAVLARLSEGVAMFDTAGKLVSANAAFRTLWQLAPGLDAPGTSIIDMIDAMSKETEETPVWDDLTEFATRSAQRADWTADLHLTTGAALTGKFAPMPNGSTLIVFEKQTPPQAAASYAGLKAFEQDSMEEELDTLIARVRGLPHEPSVDTLRQELDAIVERRALDLTLNAGALGSEPGLPPRIFRVAMSFGLIFAETAEPTSPAVLTLSASPDRLAVTGQYQLSQAEVGGRLGDCVPLRVLDWYAARVGGTLLQRRDDAGDLIELSCTLPVDAGQPRHVGSS